METTKIPSKQMEVQTNFDFGSLSGIKSRIREDAIKGLESPIETPESRKSNKQVSQVTENKVKSNSPLDTFRNLQTVNKHKAIINEADLEKREQSAKRISNINTALASMGNVINLFSGAPGYKVKNQSNQTEKEIARDSLAEKERRSTDLTNEAQMIESLSNTQKLREERLHQLSRDAKLNHYNSNLLKEKFGLSGAEQSKKLESQNMISERATELAYAELGGKTKQNEASNSLKSDKLTEDTRSSKANEDIKTQKLKIDSVKAEDSFKGGFYGHNRSAVPNQNGKVIGIAKTKSEKNPNNVYKTI